MYGGVEYDDVGGLGNEVLKYADAPWGKPLGSPYTQLRGRTFEVMTDDKGARAIQVVKILKDKGLIKDDIKAVELIDILDKLISVL